jgi:Putative zinc-finger
MDCKKAQRLLDDLTEGRLSETVARQLQRHVEECTDCRVASQRAARLQQLLGLKRYEQPSPVYFNNFLGEFHQRLEAETAPHVSPWDRIINNLAIEPVRTWRYGFSGAMGMALAVVLIWRGFNSPDVNPPSDADLASASNPVHVLASSTLPASHSTPRSITAPLPDSLRTTRNEVLASSAGSDVIIPTAAPSTSATRYVLDRIGITPANYEGASIHF